MSRLAIEAQGIGKAYRLGTLGKRPDSLRDAIAAAASAPLRNFRRVRSLTEFGDGQDADVLWALRDVSFEVAEGEVVGIVGRNGAGKSTLLRILSRITRPTLGRAVLRGRVGSLLEVGTGFHPDLTGRENVYLNGAILGMSRDYVRLRFDEIVEFAGVARFIDTPVKRYSSGMYLRLAFAVAAHLEPEVMVVDEVLAVGDAQFQQKCLGKMRSVSQEGRTVIFVSHNLAAVRSLCSRALMIEAGRVVEDGPAAGVVARYAATSGDPVMARTWTDGAGPANSSAVIERVVVRGSDGGAADQLTTDDAFRIDIEYRTIRVDARVGLTVYFFDHDNNCVLTSVNNREANWYGRPMPIGRYLTSCVVPGRVLNTGTFSVSVNMFGPNFSDNRQENDVLRLVIGDGLGLRGDYFGPFAGTFRPDWQWATSERADDKVA